MEIPFVEAGNKINVLPVLYLMSLGRSAKQEGVGEACTVLNGLKGKFPQSWIILPTSPLSIWAFYCEDEQDL